MNPDSERINCEFEDCGRQATAISTRTGLMACSIHDEGSVEFCKLTHEALARLPRRATRENLVRQSLEEDSIGNQVEAVLRGIEEWIP